MRNKVLQVFAGLYALAVWSIPAISAAQGQLSPEDLKAFEATMAEAQGAASLVVYAIQFVISLVMFGIGAIILLIARKDMRGWSQPVKDVWFSFDGRLNRKAYWLKGTIGLGMVGCVVNMVSVLFTLPILMFLGPTSILLGLAGLAVWLPYVVFQFWTALAIMYKRCHDRGRSAWWLLLVIVPLLNLWVMIELLFLRGTVGPIPTSTISTPCSAGRTSPRTARMPNAPVPIPARRRPSRRTTPKVSARASSAWARPRRRPRWPNPKPGPRPPTCPAGKATWT
ncbi:MAG: DUF805 domain-containing protein [Alphaproteobacteria bacterium]|nr:DUF805 domain-containing protein [Alphaproteobacteria bacterium]